MIPYVDDAMTYLDGHGHGLELKSVNTPITFDLSSARTYQIEHRLLLDNPIHRRDCELGLVSVGSLGRNLGPNLRADSIPLK